MTKRYEHQLIQIGIHPEEKFRLLEDTKANLASQLQTFNNNPHPGNDKHLGLTLEIMNRYQKTISIQSLRDCYFLSTFQPKDLAVILNNHPSLIRNLNTQLNNLEEFVIYLSEIPLPTLEVILPHTIQLFQNRLDNIPQVFDIIGPEKTDFFIKQLPLIIKSCYHFERITEHLSVAQLSQVFEVLKGRWLRIIGHQQDFERVIKSLSIEQRQQVIDELKQDLLKIIALSKGNKSFLETLSILADGPNLGIWGDSPELRTTIKKLSDGIKIITQFCRPESIEHIFSRINYKSDLIGTDFYNLIKNLSSEQRDQVFEVFKDHLQKMITNGLAYRYLTKALSEVQRRQVFESLKDHWKSIIKNSEDFKS